MMQPWVHWKLPVVRQILPTQGSYSSCVERLLCFRPTKSLARRRKRWRATGTTTAAACRDSSILATRFPSLKLARCSSSVGSAVGTACHLLPSAGERVVGRDLFFGTGAQLEDLAPESRATDFNVTLCLDGDLPATKAAFDTRNVPNCWDETNAGPCCSRSS